MIAVIAPHRHLPLAMVDGMQTPEPGKPVLRTMVKIIDRVEYQQVHDETDPGDIGDTRPQLINVESRET